MNAQRILAPIDFSDSSREALRQADDLATQWGARLTLLHVHEPPHTVFPYVEPPKAQDDLRSRVESELNAWADTLSTPEDRRTVQSRVGAPVAEIVRAAAEHDLVVMPTHGRTGLSRFRMGSVAERVVRASPCAVLVVKRGGRAGSP